MYMLNARTLTAAAAAVLLLGCGINNRSTTVESGGDIAPVTPVNNRTLPAGATLTARLDQELSTRHSKAGDAFTATVSTPLTAQNGSVVVPQGAKIHGHVTATDPSDRAGDPALIRLNFERLSFNGQSHPFNAQIVQSAPVESSTHTTRNVVIGGAVGAALGGLVSGGDLDKLIIGGAIGAAAGSVVSMGSDVNATLPAGSAMTLRATQTTQLR